MGMHCESQFGSSRVLLKKCGATMSYLTLFWQAHVAATGLRLGGFGAPVWKWLSAADMAKGIAG